jgi:hypothetical protein
MDLEQNLRTVSDDMLRTLEQLLVLETQKRSELPGTPRFVKLAKEIEALAAIVFQQTTAQQTLAKATQDAAEEGADLAPIDEIAASRDVSLILAEWREAERRLGSSAMDSAEHAKAAADVRRLRDEYHRAYQSQSAEDGRRRGN